MSWIFQRKRLPCGTYKDVQYSPDVPYRCYETIKATKRGESSVDLELLESNLPPFNLTHQAWFAMRRDLNDYYDQLMGENEEDEICNCPRYTHIRIFNHVLRCEPASR